MSLAKKNVAEFNGDVKTNEGYLYSTNAPVSSILANRRISDAVARHILPSHQTLVDIGSGDGVYTAELKERFPHLAISAFDPASDAVALSQKKYLDITFMVGNILSDDIVAATPRFDVGVIRGVLHHLSDQQLAIKNALQICTTLIIVEPNGNNPVLKVIEKVSPYHIEHEEQSFSFWRIKKWIEKADGRLADHEYVGFVPMFCPDSFARVVHFFQPLLEKIPVIREFLSAQIILVCERNPRSSVK